jgi:hypothetical protein
MYKMVMNLLDRACLFAGFSAVTLLIRDMRCDGQQILLHIVILNTTGPLVDV